MNKLVEKAKNKLTDIFKGAVTKVSPMVKKEVAKATGKVKSDAIDYTSSAVKVGTMLFFAIASLKPVVGVVEATSKFPPNGFFISYNETTINNYYLKGGTLDGNGNQG